MQYSSPYILLIVFILTISIIQLALPLDLKSRKQINFIVLLTYILFFGFRGFIATDWINYYVFFKRLSPNFIEALSKSNGEIGFVLYSVFIKNIFSSYEGFQVINTLTNVFLLHFFFKRYLPIKYYTLGVAVFIVFYGGLFEINLLRNFKALLVFLLALPYIEQRKPIKYFGLIIIALLFHWSSIVFIPLYFFLHKKTPIFLFLFIFILGSIIYLLQIDYIAPIIKSISIVLPKEMANKILFYLQSSTYAKSYGLTFGYFERALTAFFILLNYKRITENKSNILFVNSFLIFICLYLYFSEITIVLERVAGNFAYAYWIIIPTIIQKTDRPSKPFLFIFWGCLLIAKIFLIMNFIFYEYDSFLVGKAKSYEQRYEVFKHNKKLIEKKN